MLVTGSRSLTFLVEEARQAANLKLAIQEKISTSHHYVAFLQSTDHRIRIVGARSRLDLDRGELALRFLDVDELANAAVENRSHGHG